jgi:hypothetical protein
MAVTLFSRDNVSITDIDLLDYTDLVYWYDAHIQITRALKKKQESQASQASKKTK